MPAFAAADCIEEVRGQGRGGSVDSGSVGVAAAAPVGGVEAGVVGFLFLLRLRFVVPQ
eukprot:CAMPEP_0119474044 /NCGR_PEP_ID=MMETSP1344-20130328/5454_1 /TAXON_ID=236787 /ORGANISM="Florenciella parvula, Strain CCMP2471" /LENGTH=57 /DNA_ID=CAMNT_0007507261 /DNA_START=615 /DNA_END=788 /DNA_ORIENTATION=-